MRDVHPIEVRSYAVLRSRVDLSHLPTLSRAVVERVVHASADFGYVEDMVLDENVLVAAGAALRGGAPVVADVAMVAAGITGVRVVCRLPASATPGSTRSAAGIRLASDEVGPGAVWAIGCAPTALAELLRLDARPALVVGLPVGFVGATQAKAALRASGLPAVTNVSEKGGAAVTAAVVNALWYAAAPSGESELQR